MGYPTWFSFWLMTMVSFHICVIGTHIAMPVCAGNECTEPALPFGRGFCEQHAMYGKQHKVPRGKGSGLPPKQNEGGVQSTVDEEKNQPLLNRSDTSSSVDSFKSCESH